MTSSATPKNSPAPVDPEIITNTGLTFALKKYVTLTCKLAAEKGAVIDGQEGMRLKVAYKSPASSVVLEGPVTASGLTGEIKSGGDWVFVRNDGVIFVDARVTVAFADGTTAATALVDATLKGSIDLCRTFALGANEGETAFEEFKRGTREPALKMANKSYYHQLVGGLRFEVGSGDDWANDNIKATTKHFDELRLLVRQQFMVVGTVTIDKVPRYDPIQIVIEAWGI
jgi:hypothetical protein